MKFLSLISATALVSAMCAAAPAQAAVGFADVVIDFFDSGAGPFAGPYGGTFPGSFPVAVSTSVVLGDEPVFGIEEFLSLPTGSYVTVGFTDELIFDSAGNDIFIREAGASGETAQIFVSNDLTTYQLLGIANSATTTSFDLASIGFTGNVLGLRIVGLDSFGASPGFDVVNIQAIPGSFTPSVPEPTTWGMMLLGFGILGSGLRRARQQSKAVAA